MSRPGVVADAGAGGLNFVRHAKSEGSSVIFITHNVYHAYEVADRIAILDRGQIVGEFRAKRSPWSNSFSSCSPPPARGRPPRLGRTRRTQKVQQWPPLPSRPSQPSGISPSAPARCPRRFPDGLGPPPSRVRERAGVSAGDVRRRSRSRSPECFSSRRSTARSLSRCRFR